MVPWILASALTSVLYFCETGGSLSLFSNDAFQQAGPSNITLNTTTSSGSDVHALRVGCDGSQYGRDLSESSCLSALSGWSQCTRVATFGRRNTGNWNILLPQRIVGGDGRCAFTITSDTVLSERASLQKTWSAAEALIRACVPGTGPTSGGLVTGIGERGRLKIEMKAYRTMIRCTPPRKLSLQPTGCDYTCDNMVLSKSTTGIRHSRQSNLDIVVPYEMSPTHHACLYRVDLAGDDDLETRYHIWEAMAALDDMCANQGKLGIAYRLGEQVRVIVELVSGGEATSTS